MEVEARAATADDLAVVADLAGEAIEELTPQRGGEVWRRVAGRDRPVLDSLQGDLDAEVSEVIVGTIDDVVVGYAVVHADQLRDGSTLGRISDLFTLPGARGVGIGEAMMDEVLAWCRSNGCFGVDSIALPGERHTKNFFEASGLVARAIVVHRDLGE